MKCTSCNSSNTKVIETRTSKDSTSTRRRRECEECHFRFTTVETVLVQLPSVVKKNGKKEAFSHAKILKGLKASCLKRPVTQDQLTAIVKKIVRWAENLREEEISSSEIGIMVLQELKNIDKVASIRFASVHQTFNDIDEFLTHLETL